MKKQLQLSAIAILFALHLNAQSTIGGVISVDTTLSLANSPYIVTNNLLVQQGKKVIVEPGVIFKFQQGIYLQVDGEFQAIGSDGLPITFTKDSLNGATNWGGIFFTNISIDYNEQSNIGCIMSNCIVEYGQSDNDEMIYIFNCSPMISNSIIRNSHYFLGIIAEGIYSSPTIVNNKIYNVGIAIECLTDNWGLIQGNEIFNCGDNNPAVFIGKAIFTDNYVHNCSNDQVILVNDTCIINNNIFENLSQYAIVLNGGDAHIIKCNTFSNNGTNMVIFCERHPVVINNNFLNYINWNVYWEYWPSATCHVPYGSGVYATIDLGNNYWGGLTNAQMDASIWDFNDDFSLKALIAYTPTFPDSVNFSTADCSYPSVGINEVSAGNDNMIEIYPNPFHDMSYIKAKSIVLNERYKVFIFDSFGRIVRQIQVTNPERIEVSRDRLTSGMYAYQLVSPEKKVYSGKFIVE